MAWDTTNAIASGRGPWCATWTSRPNPLVQSNIQRPVAGRTLRRYRTRRRGRGSSGSSVRSSTNRCSSGGTSAPLGTPNIRMNRSLPASAFSGFKPPISFHVRSANSGSVRHRLACSAHLRPRLGCDRQSWQTPRSSRLGPWSQPMQRPISVMPLLIEIYTVAR